MSTAPCTECRHPLTAHQAEDGKVAACRITRCTCWAFAEPAPEPLPAGPRRVCVDVPDGYVLSFSLIPHQEATDA